MARNREIYSCSVCGAQSTQWRGQCPSCREWNTLRLRQAPTARPARNTSAQPDGERVIRLADVDDTRLAAYGTGLGELDRILGGGLMQGASLLLGGEPGIGKSTLLLQIAGAIAAGSRKVLYATGEESLHQVRARAERLGSLHENLLAIATNNVDEIVAAVEGQAPHGAPALLVVDSIQTMCSGDVDGLPGNVNQIRASATRLLELGRNAGCTVILVGHVTKDGVLAGPRLLEHMVDTVVSLEGDRRQMFRLLRVFKNRFGPNEELLVFRMEGRGLRNIEDPSTFFLGGHDPELSGTALVMSLEGNRPLSVEAQALVSRTYLSIPRRTALGLDINRLHLLLAVMEKRLRLNFGQSDIYTKIGGGIRLSDPGIDLALVAAILSSFYDRPLPEKCICWGEVDLNGQVRPVAGQEARLLQARRLGYDPILCPASGEAAGSGSRIRTIAQLQKALFGK